MQKAAVMLKVCTKCKKTMSTDLFHKKGNGDKRRGDCKFCVIQYKKIYRTNPKNRFTEIKFSAESRGINFSLSLKEIESFANTRCIYCNSKVNMISLDRVNNDLGYEIDNVVSCCGTCNRMKSDMDVKVFIKHIREIYLITK